MAALVIMLATNLRPSKKRVHLTGACSTSSADAAA
jgi:hypothetical protein